MKTILTLALLSAVPVSAATLSGLALSGGGQYQWPTSTIIAANEQTNAANTQFSARDVKSNRDQGQTFTIAQNGTIDRIAFNFEAFSNTGNAAFTFNFFKVVSATDPTMVGGVIDSLTVAATDITALGFANGVNGTLVFDVANTAVTAGDAYAFQLDTDLADTLHIVKLRKDNAGAYTGGETFGNDIPSPDIHFGVYAIPEPSSFLLGGVCTLFLLMRRQRR